MTKKSWHKSVKKARKKLGVVGFVPIGGRSVEGKRLLKLARQYHNGVTVKSKHKSRRKSRRKSKRKSRRKSRRKSKRKSRRKSRR